MLGSTQLLNSSDEKDLSTYVVIPLDSLKNSEDHGDLEVIQNIIIKQLEDGSICLVDEGKQNAYQEECPLPITTTTPSINSDFLQNTPARDHIRWHKCQKKFKCPKCSTGYNIENNLKIHMVLVHSEKSNTQCPICDVNLTFKRAASLKSHLILHQVEEFYTCDECDREFDKEDDFMKHVETHVTVKKYKEKPLTCSYCKVEFQNVKELRDHVSDHMKLKKTFSKPKRPRPKRPRKSGPEKGNNYVCFVCNKSFNRNSLLVRHERIHSGEKPYECEICDREFTQKATLQIHLSRHAGLKPFSCTLCPAKFNQKGNLRVHIQRTHTVPSEGQKMYKCWQCTCIFKNISSLNRHMTMSHLTRVDNTATPGAQDNLTDETELQLKELQKQISSTPNKDENTDKNKENQLMEGVIVEDNLKEVLDFAHLSESFNVGTTVRKHLVTQKKIGDVRWYFCNYCSKQFKRPLDLIRHIRVHTREKPFKCKQCKDAFSLKSTLISHMKTHRSKLDYRCKICNSSFVSLGILNAHLRKHDFDSLPKWQCITCDYLFDELEKGCKHREEKGHDDKPHIIQPFMRNILKQPLHETAYGSLPLKPAKQGFPNTDTEFPTIKPFHCTICDARFTRRINLKRHVQYHNGERNFKCNICPKTFITSYKLKVHQNYHNNVKNYPCTVCGKRFVTASILKRHVISHNTRKLYQCPYCMKMFKILPLCRTHINEVHKKDVVSKDLQTNSENLEIQQFLPSSNNSLQILNTNVDEDPNNYQTIYLNIVELPPSPNLNSPIQPPLKLQNTDALLMNPTNDLQEESIKFDINSLKSELDLPPDEIFTNSHNENIDVSKANNTSLPNIAETSTKSFKSGGFSAPLMDPMNDLQDDSIKFNIDSVKSELDSLSDETFTNSHNENIDVSTANTTALPSIAEISTKGIKSDSFSTLLKNSMNDLQDDSIKFDIDSLKSELDLPPDEIFTNCHNEKIDVSTANTITLPSIEDISTKSLKSDIFSEEIRTDKPANRNQPTYECSVCQKVIQGRNLYSKHLASHTGSSLLRSCKYCFKDFKKPSDLIRHLRTHTGEKPFVCHLCNKRFSLKSTLESHIKTHKQLSCNVCKLFFSSRSNLKRHMIIHIGQITHPCSFCSQKFKTARNRKSHELLIHLSKSEELGMSKHTRITNVLESVASEVIKSVNSTPTDNSIPVESKDIVSTQDDL